MLRVCFINASPPGRLFPQGLKPAFFLGLNGTAEAVPYPKPIYETRSSKTLALLVLSVQGFLRASVPPCLRGEEARFRTLPGAESD